MRGSPWSLGLSMTSQLATQMSSQSQLEMSWLVLLITWRTQCPWEILRHVRKTTQRHTNQSQDSNLSEKLLPRVGLEPTTFSILGWSSTNLLYRLTVAYCTNHYVVLSPQWSVVVTCDHQFFLTVHMYTVLWQLSQPTTLTITWSAESQRATLLSTTDI